VRLAFLFAFLATGLVAKPGNRKQELQYYRNEFDARYQYPLYDTLFEKIVWERKVSHLVMEVRGDEYRVTLLMMEEYPYNYKGQNYPIYFGFKSFAAAAQKLEAMNYLLRNNGVMAVGINGSKIIHERLLVAPRSDIDNHNKILTREQLPRRLPIEIRFDSATSH
jgi:hypothetical protein